MNTGYREQRKGFRRNFSHSFLYFVILLTIPYTLYPIPYLHAQANSPTTTPSTVNKKNVVKNFKINLSEYSSFGSDCTKKPQGDANCDSKIDQFDLSIWEVEFNSKESPKRSDFNNDGAITLLDYGIWRNTTFPQKTSGLIHYLSSRIQSGIQLLFPGFQFKSGITVFAQESGGSEVNSSSTFISSSGSSMVFNSISGGNTQQVNFTSSANPQSASFYNSNGASYAEVAFTQSGGTVISTEQSGIPVTINKTAAGPIIENFRNPDGTLLAIKSWPTQESYDRNDPPLSVTIPGQGHTREVLNIQPNFDSIVERVDQYGNIYARTQLRANGVTLTEDFQNKTITESSSQVGFTNLSMKNNIGGETQYIFFKGKLYTIIQTNDKKSTYIAKPLDAAGDSWTLETHEDGVKRSQKTVANPITELNTGTPDPKTLVQYINYYKQAQPNTAAVNFSDGFTTTTGITTQIQKANNILTIAQTSPPAVLGIVKVANAQEQNRPSAPITPPEYQATFREEKSYAAVTDYVFDLRDAKTGETVGVEIHVQLANPDNLGIGTGDIGQVVTTRTDGTQIGQKDMTTDPATAQQTLSDIRNGNLSIAIGPDMAGGGSTTQVGISVETPAEAAAPGLPAKQDFDARDLNPAAAPAGPAAGAPFGETASFQAHSPIAAAASVASAPSAIGDQYAMGTSTATVIGVNGTSVSVDVYDPDTDTSSTFTHDPTTGYSAFKDADGNITTAHSGTFSGVSFADGSAYAVTSDGFVVDVSALGAGAFNPDGTLNADVEAVAREHNTVTDQGIIDAVSAQVSEHISSGGNGPSIGNQANSSCFLPGTKISTPSGLKNIEDFNPGDQVFSYNEKTGQKQIALFKELDINFVEEYLVINGKIKTTVYHPFYIVQSEDYSLDSHLRGNDKLITVRADELKAGDILQNEQGKYIPVYSIEKIAAPKTTVYNLMNVSPNNNFFAEGILVHNYGGGGSGSVDDTGSSNQDISSDQTGGTDWGGGDSGYSGGGQDNPDSGSSSSGSEQ